MNEFIESCFQFLFRKSYPSFKKVDKQLLKNFQPISLLPITGKTFERLLYNQMFEFFIRNN